MAIISRCMFSRVLLYACFAIVLAGCGARSISNSGYYADSDRGYWRENSSFYKGELSEFDVLGIDPRAAIAESEIQEALTSRQRMTIPKSSAVMLVQSGAIIPDETMSTELGKYYNVSVFSGVPERAAEATGSYAKALRLAAARGGNATLLVYWGLLETGRENLATKTVSWVPIVGAMLPDESQRMRIRLKVAVVDVESGRWEMFTPEPFEAVDTSGRFTRVSSDQAQVAQLKDKGYRAAVADLVNRYAR